MTNFTKIFILPSMERNPHQLSTHWRPQQPSHLRPPDFNWRPQDFHRRPHIFIETPDVQWTSFLSKTNDKSVVSNKNLMVSDESLGVSNENFGDFNENLRPAMKSLGSPINI